MQQPPGPARAGPMHTPYELVERFARLYSGYTKAYGQTAIRGTANDRGKVTARSWTEHKELTLDLYGRHLAGDGPGLGVLMLRDDNATVLFGAIDIDDYNTDHLALERQTASLGVPLVVIRSKSGGAHLMCFCEEPIEAVQMQQKLSEWCALLGYSDKTEIFPKQTARAATGGDVGSYINLPYYEHTQAVRYGIFQGKALSFAEFLEYAESRRVTYAMMHDVKYTAGDPKDLYYEGPPCLQHLFSTGGFVEGTKRNGVFDVGVYLRKRYPDNWDDRLIGYNAQMCEPPLRNDEVQDIIKSLKKKDYQYQCKQPPIVAHCQRRLCLSRKYGVGDVGPQAMGLEITAVTRYQVEDTDDPPMWGLEIGGHRVLIDNSTFYERDAFNKAVLAAISRVPIHVPPARWLRMVDELAANADVVLTPKEVSPTGNLLEWITAYLAGAKATALEQIAVSGAYLEEGHIFFRAMDLFLFLDGRRVAYKNKQTVYHLLKKMRGESRYQNFKKGGFNVWKVPAPAGVGASADDEQPDFTQQTPF